jgi:hypothetical protein
MSKESSVARFTTMALLNGPGVSKLRSFTFDGYNFNPSNLSLMAYEIRDDRMHVAFDARLVGKAIYNSTENTLYLGFVAPSSVSRQALIVHEVTHAVCDFQAKVMDVATSESIAYIAQCQYARANSGSDDPDARLYDEDEAKDRVFSIGWNIAGKILDGGSVSQEDINELRYAVRHHPTYASDAASSAGFDGY